MQLIWFMSPSVALSEQQCKAIQRYLSGYQVLSLMGRDGVDKWTDQKLWDAVLTNVRVVVGTPQVLVDALTHGFVRMSRLALLVFDEGMCTLHLVTEFGADFGKQPTVVSRTHP